MAYIVNFHLFSYSIHQHYYIWNADLFHIYSEVQPGVAREWAHSCHLLSFSVFLVGFKK